MATGDPVTWRPGKEVTLSCLSVVFAVVGVGVGVASSLVVFGVVLLGSTAPCVQLIVQTPRRPRLTDIPRTDLPPTRSSAPWDHLASDPLADRFGAGLRIWERFGGASKNRGSAWGRFTGNIANWFWRIGSTHGRGRGRDWIDFVGEDWSNGGCSPSCVELVAYALFLVEERV